MSAHNPRAHHTTVSSKAEITKHSAERCAAAEDADCADEQKLKSESTPGLRRLTKKKIRPGRPWMLVSFHMRETLAPKMDNPGVFQLCNH